jgi:hypothetical protein
MDDIKRDIGAYLFCVTDPKSSSNNKICKGIYNKINKLKSDQKEHMFDCLNNMNELNMTLDKNLQCANAKNINQQEIYLYDYDDLILYKDPKNKNITFCFTKDEVNYLKDVNPYTNEKFSDDFLKYVKTVNSEDVKSLREYIENEIDDVKYKKQQEHAEKIDAIDNVLQHIDKYLSVGAYLELDDKFKIIIYKIAGKKISNDEIINFLYNNKSREDLRTKISYIYMVVKHGFLLGEIDSENTSEDQKNIYRSQMKDMENLLIGHEEMNKVFVEATRNGNLDVVKTLLKNPRVDPSFQHQLPLKVAISEGYSDIVKILLKDPRVDPSAQDQTFIGIAASFGFLKIVKMLLKDPRVDPSANNQYALKYASRRKRYDVVKMLLKDPRVNSYLYL